MRIVSARVVTLVVPFRRPVQTGARRWAQQRIGLLSLRTDSGVIGLGEYVAPEPDDLGEPTADRLSAALSGLDLGDPVRVERALREMDGWPFVGRVARGAAESAIVDLRARASGVSVAASLAAGPAADVAVNELVTETDPAVAAAAAARAAAAGFATLKLKAGREPLETLLARVAAVRDAVGPDVRLRIDFNGSLERGPARDVLAALAPADLEYVEQPIPPAAGPAALAALRERVPIPIAADESVRDLGSARALVEAGAVDALVVKPARVGGLRQARAIVELATEHGIPVTISTLFESGVGIAGALHLAATVPGPQAHGLATAALLESDLLRRPLGIAAGRMAVPAAPGLGVEVDEAAVSRYRAS